MNTDFFDIVNDKERMHKHILFCGTFILVYEYFISSWKQGVFFLYTHCQTDINNNSDTYHTDIQFKKIQHYAFEQQKEKLKQISKRINKDYQELRAKYGYEGELMFLWMREHGFITDKEQEILEACRSRRHSYAHDLDQTLKASITQKEKYLLKSLVNIAENASQKWNDKVKGSTLSVRDAIIEIAKESGLETPVFQTNTGKFLSLVLEHLKDITYGETENANHEYGR